MLKDGSTIEFTNDSTITHLTTVVLNFGLVNGLLNTMTEDNLSQCQFDGVDYTDVVLDTVTTFSKGYGNVQVTFLTKTESDEEIESLRQQVAELENQNQSLVSENETLTNENQELINENMALSDKAEAADILMGIEEV